MKISNPLIKSISNRSFSIYIIYLMIISSLIFLNSCKKQESKPPQDKHPHSEHQHNHQHSHQSKEITYPKAHGGETKKPLSPDLFVGKPNLGEAVQAYKVANEIPQVLDKIFCYCYCQDNQHFKHKSLLTCFSTADHHGAYCGICQKQALYAGELHKKGLSIEQIVVEENKKYYHPSMNQK